MNISQVLQGLQHGQRHKTTKNESKRALACSSLFVHPADVAPRPGRLSQRLLKSEAEMLAFLETVRIKARPGRLVNPSGWIVAEAKIWRQHHLEGRA